jgi:hypothetical protein
MDSFNMEKNQVSSRLEKFYHTLDRAQRRVTVYAGYQNKMASFAETTSLNCELSGIFPQIAMTAKPREKNEDNHCSSRLLLIYSCKVMTHC